MHPMCQIGQHKVIKKTGKIGNVKLETWVCARQNCEWDKVKSKAGTPNDD